MHGACGRDSSNNLLLFFLLNRVFSLGIRGSSGEVFRTRDVLSFPLCVIGSRLSASKELADSFSLLLPFDSTSLPFFFLVSRRKNEKIPVLFLLLPFGRHRRHAVVVVAVVDFLFFFSFLLRVRRRRKNFSLSSDLGAEYLSSSLYPLSSFSGRL